MATLFYPLSFKIMDQATGVEPRYINNFKHLISESHIFLIDNEIFRLESQKNRDDFLKIASMDNTSLPFKNVWVEFEKDGVIHIKEPDVFREIIAFSLHEINPGEILCMLFQRVNGRPTVETGEIYLNKPSDITRVESIVTAFLIQFCDYLKKCKVGYEKYHRQIPIKIGHHKYFKSISRVIRLAPEKEVIRITPEFARTIEWDHSWFVRGHWRAHPGGIGKCRDGTYTVNGFTWVTPHVKGNKDVEPTKKIYMLRH